MSFVPLWAMSKRKLSLFLMATLKILAGDKVFHELTESDGFGLNIPIAEGQDEIVMYCSQSLAHYGGSFWKGKDRVGRVIFFLKISRMVEMTEFLLLELLPNMPDMQSLKVLLLFAKQQCSFFAATTRSSILCHHPFSNTSFDQKSPGHPKVGVSQSHRQTNTHKVTQTNIVMQWLTRPRVSVGDNLDNSKSIFLKWASTIYFIKLLSTTVLQSLMR